MTRTPPVALALAAAALAAGGCGSSAKPLTRAELTAKANSICKSASGKLTAKSVSSVQGVARTAPQLASIEQGALTRLSKLVPPASMESEWKTFIAGAQELSENTAKLGEYAKKNELQSARSLIVSSEATVKQMSAIMKEYGISDCEQVP